MSMLRRVFGRVTPASLVKDLLVDAKQEHADAQRQLILAKDNLFTAEAAIRYTEARLGALIAASKEHEVPDTSGKTPPPKLGKPVQE